MVSREDKRREGLKEGKQGKKGLAGSRNNFLNFLSRARGGQGGFTVFGRINYIHKLKLLHDNEHQ
jgi:hypothetical protein